MCTLVTRFCLAALLAIVGAFDVTDHGTSPDKFGGSTPYILIARIKVKSGKVKEYLEAAAAADNGVMNSEPGMLHHTWDLDPTDPTGHSFVWSEVYADSASFVKHVENPVVGTYLGKHGELGESFTVEFYGTIDEATTKVADSLGLPVTYYKTQLGYSRVGLLGLPATAASVVGTSPDKFGGSTPYILIARIKVKPGKVKEYLEAAAAADEGVMNSEPGMLHHTWDLDPTDSTGHSFVWSEVYADSASFVKHVENPVVGTYLGKHGELGESFTVEFYGTIDSETTKVADSLGLPVTYYKTQLGYSRVKNQKITDDEILDQLWAKFVPDGGEYMGKKQFFELISKTHPDQPMGDDQWAGTVKMHMLNGDPEKGLTKAALHKAYKADSPTALKEDHKLLRDKSEL